MFRFEVTIICMKLPVVQIKSNALLLLCVDCGTFEVYKRHEGTNLCEIKQYCNKIATYLFCLHYVQFC